MKRVRYPAEFKAEAVKQVTDRGHGAVDLPCYPQYFDTRMPP